MGISIFNTIRSVLIAIPIALACNAHAASLNPHLTRHAYLDEIQVLSDVENGTEYAYSKVWFTPLGSTTQEYWVLPLQRNGVDITGSTAIQAMLQQAIATKSKVFLHAVDTWGLGAQSYFSLFEVPRIRRLILYK